MSNLIEIPENFDFSNIPPNYENSIWEIRFLHDLKGILISLLVHLQLLFRVVF